MKLPGYSVISVSTLVDELLQSGEHAAFLASAGYSMQNWSELESDLRQLLAQHANYIYSDDKGNYYKIVGQLHHIPVVTIWLWEQEVDAPRFTTLFPLDK